MPCLYDKGHRSKPRGTEFKYSPLGRSLADFFSLLILIREQIYQESSAGHTQAGCGPRSSSTVEIWAARWKGDQGTSDKSMGTAGQQLGEVWPRLSRGTYEWLNPANPASLFWKLSCRSVPTTMPFPPKYP